MCIGHGGLPNAIFAYKQPVQIHRGVKGRVRKGGKKETGKHGECESVCVHARVFLLKESVGKGVCLSSSGAEGLSI